MLQKLGDRVSGLLHRSHPDQSLKQVDLGELALNWDGQMLIQCRDSTSATSFRFAIATLPAGCLLPLGERHDGTPATHIDLSLFCGFLDSAKNLLALKLAKY